MTKKKRLIGPILLALLVLTAFSSLLFGSVSLSPGRLLDAVRGQDRTAEIILLGLRLPRLLAALLAGAGLALSGFLLQTVTDNDLCAPSTVGVNAGAGFCVMLMLCYAPMQWRLQPLAAFFGAVGTTALVLSVSRWGGRYGGKATILLSGVAVSAMLNGGISFLSLRFPEVLSSYQAFSVGGFSGVTMKQLPIPAVMVGLCFAISMLLAPKISLLCLGDEAAATLGVRVGALRMTVIFLASALCAAVVSFAGLLGFVGLIVPHVVRRLVPGSLRRRLPYGALCGALLTTLSDLLGRTLFTPGELPAGLLMAFIGAPFFLSLLIGRRGRHD